MCFGVSDALARLAAVPEPRDVTIHGELVHNEVVLADLARRGFTQSPEASREIPETPIVLVTAHGVSDRERAKLLAAGKEIVDTTCPLVRKVHTAATALAAEGRRVLVIGRPGHVEVRGIVEDLDGAEVLAGPADARPYGVGKLGVLCQTTTREETAMATLAAIHAANPHADIRFVDTICSPTRARIAALAALLPQVDALVVVGGHDSNNTRQLAATGRKGGKPVAHVADADELDPVWCRRFPVIGLTAGTSTLAATVDAVHARLLAIAAAAPPRAAG